MPIKVIQDPITNKFQYIENYGGDWKPFGPQLDTPPSKEEFDRYKGMGAKFAQRKPEEEGIKLSAEAQAKVHGRDPQGIFDTIQRNLENTWFGVKQMTGNTTPEEDAEWAKEEQIRSNLTPWPTAGGALGTEMIGGTVGPNVIRKGLTTAARHAAEQRIKDPMKRSTPVSESIKSLADKLEYGHGSVMPLGLGGGAAGAGVGIAAPLTPEEMSNEWQSRFTNSAGGAIAGKTLDTLFTGAGLFQDYGKALDFDKELAGDLPKSLRFPRHLALQDPKANRDWQKAKQGGYGDRAQGDVYSSERRTNLKLQDNVNDIRKSFANDDASRERMGLPPIGGPKVNASNKIAEGWETPLNDMRKEARMLKNQGKKLYEQSRVLGPINGRTDAFKNALEDSKRRFSEGPNAKYFRTDIHPAVKGAMDELDKIGSKDSNYFSVHDLMGLHRKLNNSWRKEGTDNADMINGQISAMKKEIDTMIDKSDIYGDPKALSKWREARGVYTDWNQKYMDDPITRMAIDPDTSPERLANKMFPRSWESTTSLDDRNIVVGNLLKVHPNWKPYLKQDLFNSMASDSKNGIFDSKKFTQTYNDHVATGRFLPVMDQLFDKDEMSRLGDLYNVTTIRNTNFADPDFTPGYAPGPVAEFTAPLSYRPGRWGAAKSANAIRRARAGAMPSGYAYPMTGGIGSEELAAAMGIDWNNEKPQVKEFFRDLVNDQNASLERSQERDARSREEARERPYERANIYRR